MVPYMAIDGVYEGLDTLQRIKYTVLVAYNTNSQTPVSPQTRVSHPGVGPDERRVLALSVALYEGGDRYRPGRDSRRCGFEYELYTATGWARRVRWYRTWSEAGHVLSEARAGRGLVGQQLVQGRARALGLVSKRQTAREMARDLHGDRT